jgi:ribosomal protein S18 acetylase RimI-like enzyme
MTKATSVTQNCRVRRARVNDLSQIVDIDERVTGVNKADYWSDVFIRYGDCRPDQRFFLVATPVDTSDRTVLGYIIGEVRAWEFGSEPCGWVFIFSVNPDLREQGIGEKLLDAISEEFRAAGMNTMRTMVQRHNDLHMAFFRSEGMMAGPYIQLEKDL